MYSAFAEWGYSKYPSNRKSPRVVGRMGREKSSFQFLEISGDGWRPATRLPRASQTCSIGFMSGEHAGYSIRTIPFSKRKSSTSVRNHSTSEDLIPTSASSQRSISNDVEDCAPFNGDATIHQLSPTAKSDTFAHERRIIPTDTVPPDENTPIVRMNRKTGLVRKKNIAPFISPPVHMLSCPLPAIATMT
ncbi:uncharacterized protein TNCV_4707621 [Trichonephila clavipes]|nr:uncharacterized protein TNCV_4707621 [Trichonephila clavipes]